MPIAVTLRLDADSAVVVERVRHALAEWTAQDDGVGYGAHITLVLLPETVDAVAIIRSVRTVSADWAPLPVTLSGLGIFPLPSAVLWVAPVVSQSLLACHDALCATLSGAMIEPHYRPGAWMPHVTVYQGLRPVGDAVEAALSAWSGPVSGKLDRVEVVQFPPVDILHSHSLRQI